MIVTPKIKSLIKEFVPNAILPFGIWCYYFILDNIFIIFYKRRLVKDFKNSVVLEKLRGKKNIRIIQTTFYDVGGKKYLSGGAERYLADLSKIIKNLGFEPYIIQYGATNWHLVHQGINVFGVKSGSLKTLNAQASNKLFGNPELVIYSPFALACRRSKIPSVGISHGIFWDQIYSVHAISAVKKSFKFLGHLVSVDTSTITWFRSTMHKECISKNMTYVPNYVDLKKYKPKSSVTETDKTIILFPRRLYEARGYFLVAAIVEYILEKYKNVEFHFVGQCSDVDAQKSRDYLVKKYKNQVQYYEQNADEMHLVYQKANITLIPTVASEGTSLSCIEAMACGNAVIATNVGGLTDLVINNYNGLMIDPNSEALKDALITLLDSKELCQKLGKNALEVAQTFGYENWQEQWSSIIKSHINNVIN